MSSNYEANRHLARQRLQARYAEAERERLLNAGRAGKPGWVSRFRAWLGGRNRSVLREKDAPAPSARKRAA